MDHEYITAQDWLAAARTFRSQGHTIRSFDDPMTPSLGFRHAGEYHFITLRTVKMAPEDLRVKLTTPESRRNLLEG